MDTAIAKLLKKASALEREVCAPIPIPLALSGESWAAQFCSLVMEASALLNHKMGPLNIFYPRLHPLQLAPPSRENVSKLRALIEAAYNHLATIEAEPKHSIGGQEQAPYVAVSRLLDIKGLNSTRFDLRKLVRLLEELNLAHVNGMTMTTAMLVRAISDHVPPIFNAKTFSEVANNVSGKSIKENLQHLDKSLRSIADGHLHAQVRPKEVLPSPSQVDFRQDLDVLLQEVVRLIQE